MSHIVQVVSILEVMIKLGETAFQSSGRYGRSVFGGLGVGEESKRGELLQRRRVLVARAHPVDRVAAVVLWLAGVRGQRPEPEMVARGGQQVRRLFLR